MVREESKVEEDIVLLRADNKEEMAKQTAAIIVSICSGQSYDPHFTDHPQKSDEGTKTLVYKVNAGMV